LSIERLLARKGLILGICNGFQALIKSGLLPWGKLGSVSKNSPTLARNLIGRHVSTMVRTKLVTNKSPWFYNIPVGSIHTMPVSHGEGRFIADEQTLKRLIDNHQIVTQYVDMSLKPTISMPDNPNGSLLAIEGIISPDGLILGKMAHSERHGPNLYQNFPNYNKQPLFESAIEYLKRSKIR
jgi:phosphoribosylformylglycinamidine synthase